QHLISVIKTSGQLNLAQAFARNPKSLLHLLPQEKITESFEKIIKADIYIIAVSDDVISQVSSQLPFTGKLTVHTSGSTSIEVLDGKNRRGVFYPLQTFSKNKEVDFKQIPVCLETEHPEDYALLSQLAYHLSQKVYKIDSIQRQALH